MSSATHSTKHRHSALLAVPCRCVGVAVIILSLFGGYRQFRLAAEEKAQNEVLEATVAMVAASRQSTDNRRGEAGRTRLLIRDVPRAGGVDGPRHAGACGLAAGHCLANGLAAPLRC